MQFAWYDVVYYFDEGANVQKGEQLGRIAGIAKNVGQSMCYRIIPLQSKKKRSPFVYLSR